MHCQQPAGHHAVLTRTSRSLRTCSPGRAVPCVPRTVWCTTGTLTKEPLAVEYTYGEDETTRNTFHFHEKYKGRAGFEAHTKAPHFAV